MELHRIWSPVSYTHLDVYKRQWTGTIEKIDTENKQANNNNMSYDGSNSDNQSSKYPFYVKLDSADGLMLGQHLYVELDEGQMDEKEGIWLYSGYIVQDEDTPYVWAVSYTHLDVYKRQMNGCRTVLCVQLSFLH